MVVVVRGIGVVVHMLTVYVTVSFVSKSKTLCTMLHGSVEPTIGNGVVVVIVDVPGIDVVLRNFRTLSQKSCVPAAATDALHISRDMMRMLTIRNTGFSAERT